VRLVAVAVTALGHSYSCYSADEKTHVASANEAVACLSLPPEAGDLSGGMKRRLSLAVALVGDSRIILADEVRLCMAKGQSLSQLFSLTQPTTGLDAASRRRVWRILDALGPAESSSSCHTIWLVRGHDNSGFCLCEQTCCRGGGSGFSHWHHDVWPFAVSGPAAGEQTCQSSRHGQRIRRAGLTSNTVATPSWSSFTHFSTPAQQLKARYGGGYRLHVNYAIDGTGAAAVAAAAERSRAASANLTIPGSLRYDRASCYPRPLPYSECLRSRFRQFPFPSC